MTPVLWTEAALAQLAAIRDYISQTSPVYAERLIARVFARGKQLGEFPLSGRQVPERLDPALREVIEWPYRVIIGFSPSRSKCLPSCMADARTWGRSILLSRTGLQSPWIHHLLNLCKSPEYDSSFRLGSARLFGDLDTGLDRWRTFHTLSVT